MSPAAPGAPPPGAALTPANPAGRPTGRTARRVLIGVATLGTVLLLAGTLLPPALGATAQRAYQDALRGTIEALPPGWVIVERYERGWFSSSASAELTLPPAPGRAGADGERRIRMDSRIEQGPWAWFGLGSGAEGGTGGGAGVGNGLAGRRGPFPALAQVHTRTQVTAGPVPLPPVLVSTSIGLDGSGLSHLRIPATDQPGAPNGDRLQHQEVTGTLEFRPNPRRLTLDLRVPGAALLTQTGPRARLTDARLTADLTGWSGGLFTGRTSLDLEAAELSPPAPVPAAPAAPADANPDAVLLEGLHLTLEPTPRGQPPTLRLDLRLDATAQRLRLGREDYRSPVIGLAVRALDTQALVDIGAALRTLSSERAPRALRGLVGATLLTQLLPRFLAAGPSLTLDPLSLTSPDGPITARLQLSATGQGSAPTGPAGLLGALLNRGPANWLIGLAGDGALDLPEPIARAWLARTAAPATAAERLQTWIDGGWISTRDGRVTSTFRLADGQVSINGKAVPLLRSVFGR